MAKVISTVKELQQAILEEVDGQENFGEIANILDSLDFDVIRDGENRYKDIDEMLRGIGEDKLADKYMKPLLEKFK